MNQSISEAARRQLRNVPETPFSIEGLSELQTAVERYIDDLLIESVHVMKRNDAPSISAQYVRMATQNIIRRRGRKLASVLGIVGGALLGGAVASVYEIVKAPRPTVQMTISAVAFVTIGLIMAFRAAQE